MCPQIISDNLCRSKMLKKTVWAVGGGKGGTGKSFVCSSLALELAAREGDVMVIDADLGGPNQHTFLAVREAKTDLADFVQKKVSDLAGTAVATPYPGLKLIKGTENLLFIANLNHYKKMKMIRQIKALDVRRVILDIGTGSSFNSLDFFLVANPGILVVTPEPTSIENTYYFLKSCIVRLLKLYMDYYRIQDVVKQIARQMEDSSQSIYSFFNTIISEDKNNALLLYRAIKKFRPCLIMNKARDDKDLILGQSIAEVVRKYLIVDLDFLGIVPFDDRVHWCLKKFEPFLIKFPDAPASHAIKGITEKLIARDAQV